MRISLTSAGFALSAFPLVASLGVENCGGGSSRLTRSCYTCPVIEYFNVGIFSWDTISRICFGYIENSSDTRMACTYYRPGYSWTRKWWGGSAERWQKPTQVGRCYFSEDGDLLTSGSYAGYSSRECPRKAYRENDSECAREKDKGSYYKCTQPNCAYETPMCYGCPRLSSDFVNVSSSNSSLTCSYSSNGKVTNTCIFNGTDGRISSSTSSSPRCPGIATLATACERSRQEQLRVEAERIAAAKKAAFIVSTYTEKGAIAVDCAEFLEEKSQIREGYGPRGGFDRLRLPTARPQAPSRPRVPPRPPFRAHPLPNAVPSSPDNAVPRLPPKAIPRPKILRFRGTRINPYQLRLICNNPQLFDTSIGAESTVLGRGQKEFADDMKAMVKTEYGTLFVMPVEEKLKLEQTLKACHQRLYGTDNSLDGTRYIAPTDEQVDANVLKLPVLPEECLRLDGPTPYQPEQSPDDDVSDDDPDDTTEDPSGEA
ncbi:hypothetical protein H0H81_000210 [Sphagnurus paluster]|uniref:Uncharacterized protein n=1 Tax=Sphagnurus paluster TaxID=117069 RepID=A0A9P7KIZ1_9AGAR|nr:hypothetical protein H0H81_000210 [Sphagnurus paluster]